MEILNKFGHMEEFEHEQLSLFYDKSTGLKAITCIHNTVLGPSLGGTRFWNYENEDDAILDVLRLARGMTYKSAVAGLPLGGGKSVIIGDARELRRDSVRAEAFWRAFGRYVEGLSGRYITAADVGTSVHDMVEIHKETNHVVGLPGRSGSPSPFTALGVFNSIKACCKHVYDTDSVEDKVVAVQGVGAVGYHLCKLLHEGGARLIVCDTVQANVDVCVEEFGATQVGIDEIYGVECDIYAPCALGATVNSQTIDVLKCKIICGGANNQLKDANKHGKMLQERGIVYAPDYVANAGGVINVSHEISVWGYTEEASRRDIDLIYKRMREILRTSEETGQLAHDCADRMAEARIAAIKNIKGIFLRK